MSGVINKERDNGMDDNQQLLNCLKGDVEEFGVIVEKYKGKAMAMAVNILGSREDAEDVCQEAFIRAFQNLNSFNFQNNFRDWFYTIVYNRCIDFIRKRRRYYTFINRKKSEFQQEIKKRPNIPQPNSTLPENLLQRLSPKERTAIFLWANESYTGDEIADILKCSAATARVHLYKARKKIKSLLEEKDVLV